VVKKEVKLTDTDLSKDEIDKKMKFLKSYRKHSNKLHGDLMEVKNNGNLTQDVVNRKSNILSNNIAICDYQIRIIENELMIDNLRKDNLKIKTNITV
jgi:hypothetical protein